MTMPLIWSRLVKGWRALSSWMRTDMVGMRGTGGVNGEDSRRVRQLWTARGMAESEKGRLHIGIGREGAL